MTFISICVVAMTLLTTCPYQQTEIVLVNNKVATVIVEDGWDATDAKEEINKITKETSIADLNPKLLTYVGIEQFELKLLSQIAWGESEGETEEGQKLVVHTVLNRARDTHGENSTIETVIYQKSQFSAIHRDNYGEYTGKEIKSTLLALMERGQGTCDDVDLEIKYFVATKEINVKQYAKRFKLKIVKQVGGHTFFVKKGE
jgi:spore germination cell wall hydrolase CwlJ-like protein